MCVCVSERGGAEGDTERRKCGSRNRERAKEGGSKVIIKAFKPWGKVFVRSSRRPYNIRIYLYCLLRVSLLKNRVGNWHLLFAAPIWLSTWKMI